MQQSVVVVDSSYPTLFLTSSLHLLPLSFNHLVLVLTPGVRKQVLPLTVPKMINAYDKHNGRPVTRILPSTFWQETRKTLKKEEAGTIYTYTLQTIFLPKCKLFSNVFSYPSQNTPQLMWLCPYAITPQFLDSSASILFFHKLADNQKEKGEGENTLFMYFLVNHSVGRRICITGSWKALPLVPGAKGGGEERREKPTNQLCKYRKIITFWIKRLHPTSIPKSDKN